RAIIGITVNPLLVILPTMAPPIFRISYLSPQDSILIQPFSDGFHCISRCVTGATVKSQWSVAGSVKYHAT
ncbi:MAG: hypothetical protein NZ802_08755, partial [Candidatus Poseidoniales archaeon]|nr:hypothetical protein [Candidatus Poseidoniales archaeon]